METEGNQKLKKVLLKLLDPNFKLNNESYLNAIIDHLKANADSDVVDVDAKDSLQEFLVLWLKQAVIKWELSKQAPNLSILSFKLNLAHLQSCKEEVFVKLNSTNIFERLLKINFKAIAETKSPIIKLGFIRLMTAFLNHKSGLQWIVSTNYWSKVLVLMTNCETLYLQKEGSHFLAQLLHKSVVINETFCNNVIKILLSPLNEVAKHTEIQERTVYQKLHPCLNVITQIFEILLELTANNNDCQVYLIFKDKFHLEDTIRTILNKIESDDFVFELNKILFILSFFNLVNKFGGRFKTIEFDKVMQASQKVYDIFIDAANRGTVNNFLKLCYIGYVYWGNIIKLMPHCLSKEKVPVLFEDQLILLQLFPVVMISLRMVGNKFEDYETDDYREDFVNQLCRIAVPNTFRTTYRWRTYLHNNFSFDHATLALKYMLHSKQFYDKRTVKTAFRILIHSLEDINKILTEQPEQVMVLIQEANYICLLIESIAVLIKEFELKWQDSVETICIMEVIFNLLSVPVWPTKLVVKGLWLLEISIANRMSPTQALLIDSTRDSFTPITTMLYAKLHDSSWEVRNTAMEVVRTICDLTNREFLSFKKLVLDTDLPSLTIKMAIEDSEPFVRASAFKCLQKMVEVDEFWEEVMKTDKNKIINVLHQEPEGIVRCEIATLISKIYIHQEISEDILEKFYSVMSLAVIVDLHWEVKIKALNFWHKVIEKHLTNQGMIDGSFPTVTFSKVKKKIITLDEREVRKRLITVLHQLSDIGCLEVFITALQDGCDLEVPKISADLIKNFVSLLKQYKITPSDFNNSPPTPPDSATFDTSVNNSPFNYSNVSTADEQIDSGSIEPMTPASVNSVMETVETKDTIMEDILDFQELNLLEDVFNSLYQPLTNTLEMTDSKIYEFLNIAFDELDKKMNVKCQPLKDVDNFNSLLDDILNEYKTDVNRMH